MAMRLRLLQGSILALLIISALNCAGQFSSGLQGTVGDKSGAAVAGAMVTLQNLDTGVVQTRQATANGEYRFPSLPPGKYRVSATAKSFDKAEVDFILSTGENRNVDLSLSIGNSVENVTVTAQGPMLDTADSREQITIGEEALRTLPLATNDPTSLLGLTPGVNGTGSATSLAVVNNDHEVYISANGRGPEGNQYILDGLDVTSNIKPGDMQITPNADAISEVSIQTNTYNVDYGRASSIQVAMSTRAGAEKYHGYGGEQYQYQGLNARGEFGVPQPTKVNPYHTLNGSFGVGGPVIPKKKQELFFFFSFEPIHSLVSNGASLITYDAPEFDAFAQTVRPNSLETQMLQKYTAHATFHNVLSTAGDVFPSTCGTAATDNLPCATPLFDQGQFNSSSLTTAKQWSIRVDKYFKSDRIYGSVFRNTESAPSANVRQAFSVQNSYPMLAFQVNETHTFSPSTLNQAAFGRIRVEGDGDYGSNFEVPVVNVTGLGAGYGVGFADGDYIQHTYHWRDVLSHILSSHSFNFGYEGSREDDIAYFSACFGIPTFQFNNMIDLINNNPYSETGLYYDYSTGKPVADNYGYVQNISGLFAEDTWRATKRLTVNYGIRYDNFGNAYPSLSGGLGLANFSLGSGSTLQQRIATGSMSAVSHVLKHDMNWIFSPRVGIAFDPKGDGKYVIRGGFGVYHDLFTVGNSENGLRGNPPGPIEPTFLNNGSTAPPIFGFGTQNVYPFGYTYPAFSGGALDSHGGIVGSQIGVGGVDRNLSSPQTIDYSATIERQLSARFVASVGYVGSHSSDLIAAGSNYVSTSDGQDVNAFAGDLLQHPRFESTGGYLGTGTQTRLNTSFGSIAYAYNAAHANYNSMIAAVKGQLGRSAFLTASYTRSSAKDNWGYTYPTALNLGPNQYYSTSASDIPNRFSLGWSYEIPGLKNNGFTRRVTSGLRLSGITALQSGAPFTVFTSAPLSLSTVGKDGAPITNANYQAELTAGNLQFNPGSGDFNADGDNNDYPNVFSYSQSTNRKAYQTGLFKTAGQFSVPANLGTEGNEKPNLFRNPGYANTNITLMKSTSIRESLNLELRVDFFNAFNRVNLTGVDSNWADVGSTFGRSTSTLPARVTQLAAKITF